MTDAILGAANAGDIGRKFPDSDPRWKGADSIELLKSAAAAIRGAGYAVSNMDVAVIAQRPKLLPLLDAIRTTSPRRSTSIRARSASRARPTKASTAWAEANRWPATRLD